MNIPRDPVERQQFYDNLIRECFASRQNRYTFYQACRSYYLFGTQDNTQAPYNKIGSTIETLCSFIYSPIGVRFSIYLGTTATEDDVHFAQPLAREITDQWRISKTHLLFSLGLRWSLAFGVMIAKVMWNGRNVRSYLVEPHQFGVHREDIIDLHDQEAFCMAYTISRTQLESTLAGNPRLPEIMRRVGRGGDEVASRPYTDGLNRLILAGPIAGIPNSVAIGTGGGIISGGLAGNGGVMYDYAPRVDTELVDMCELYVFDDEDNDYRCVTLAAPGIVIYDRPQRNVGFIRGKPAFEVIRPEINLYDYFWGDSFVARLAGLQESYTKRWFAVQRLLDKQVDPPKSVRFGMAMADEKLRALNTPGGIVGLPPQAQVDDHLPTIPDDVFKELSKIEAMFDDVAGIGHVLQGKGEAGVRSRGQADLLARLGSARPKERAAVAEESAQGLAGLMLRNVQEHSDQRFIAEMPGGKRLPFTAEQFTKDYEVHVDAHSSSPIFVEDRKQDALQLREAGAIDRETFLEMMDPPNLQHLKSRLKVMEAKEAQAQQQKQALEMATGKAQK